MLHRGCWFCRWTLSLLCHSTDLCNLLLPLLWMSLRHACCLWCTCTLLQWAQEYSLPSSPSSHGQTYSAHLLVGQGICSLPVRTCKQWAYLNLIIYGKIIETWDRGKGIYTFISKINSIFFLETQGKPRGPEGSCNIPWLVRELRNVSAQVVTWAVAYIIATSKGAPIDICSNNKEQINSTSWQRSDS